MIRRSVAALFAASIAAVATVPAFALGSPVNGLVMQQQAAPSHDVVPTVIWAIVAVLIAALVGGIMYAFKRQVGGFPKNPSWVAPISIMLSRDLPDETRDAHGAAGHENHPPAH